MTTRPASWWRLMCGLLAGPALLAGERLLTSAAEVEAAVREAQAGDTLVLADGEWRDVDLLLVAAGEPDRPVTLRAQTPGRVVVCGRSRLRIAGHYAVVSGLWFRDADPAASSLVEFRADSRRLASHCRLTESAITGCNPSDLKRDTKWVSLYGTDNRVDHCYLAGKTNLGTTLVVWVGAEPNRHRIDRNHFGPRPRLGENGGETIRVGTSDVSLRDSLTVVEENLFERCNGELECISSKSCGNIYRRNTFRQCTGALCLRHGNRCLVEANVFLGEGQKSTAGIRVIGDDHRVVNNYFAGLTGTGARSAVSLANGIPDSPLSGYVRVQRARVVGNTFVDCRSVFDIGTGASEQVSLPPRDCRIAANLFVRPGRLVTQHAAPESLVWEGNLSEGVPAAEPLPAGVRTVAGLLAESAEPGGRWRPGPDSPARGAARGLADLPPTDLDGDPRPATDPDAGCDQFDGQPPRCQPLTPADVGPAWLTNRPGR